VQRKATTNIFSQRQISFTPDNNGKENGEEILRNCYSINLFKTPIAQQINIIEKSTVPSLFKKKKKKKKKENRFSHVPKKRNEKK